MRLLAFFEYSAIVVGLFAMLAGHAFGAPKGFHLGVFLVGAGIALGGLESVFTRRMGFRWSDDRHEAYSGAPAFIVGLMALGVGSALVFSAYLLDQGLWHATLARLARRPGPAFVGAGLLLLGCGVLMMLTRRRRRGLAWTLFVRVPRAALGLVFVALGLAGAVAGAWEWLDPAGFERLARSLPQHPAWRALDRWSAGLFGLRR